MSNKKLILKALCIFFITGAFLFMAYSVDNYNYQNEMYNQKVKEIIFEHGLRVTEIGSNQKGLAYYEIINLDKSGNQRELYVLYFDKNKPWEVYTEEIWSYNLEKERLECIHSYSHNASGKIDDLTTSFVYGADKTFLMKVSSYTKGDGDHPYQNRAFARHSFFGMVDNNFVQIGYSNYIHESNVNDDNDYQEKFFVSVNNENSFLVCESEYYEFLNSFNFKDDKKIIISEAGAFNFAFDISKNKDLFDLTPELLDYLLTIAYFFVK